MCTFKIKAHLILKISEKLDMILDSIFKKTPCYSRVIPLQGHNSQPHEVTQEDSGHSDVYFQGDLMG